jgi:hypothetical protein
MDTVPSRQLISTFIPAGLPRLASTEAGLAAGRVAVTQLSDSDAAPLKTQIASDLADVRRCRA